MFLFGLILLKFGFWSKVGLDRSLLLLKINKLQNKNSQKLTNDPWWAEFHADLLKKDFVKYLLSIKSNFGKDGLVEDDVLAKYGISCLNECSNNGKCYKSKTKIQNIRVHTTIVAAFIVR